MPDVDQLYESFANIKALEEQRKKILTIFADVEAGVKRLSGFGIRIESAKGVKDMAETIKQLTKVQTDYAKQQKLLIETQQKYDALLEKSEQQQKKNTKASVEDKLAKQESLKIQKEKIKLNQQEEDSIAGLGLRLEKARRIYDQLNAQQRESARGKTLLTYIQNTSKAYDGLRASTDRYQQRVGNYQGAAQTIVEAFRRISERVKTLTKDLGENDPATQGARREMEALQRVVDNPQFLNISAKVGDTRGQITFLTNALVELKKKNLEGSDSFKEVEAELVKTKREMKDVKDEVTALTSKTRGFDLFASAVSSLVSIFETAAGASALFGEESEHTERIIKKLIAIQSIANGVREISKQLTEETTAAGRAYNFVLKQYEILTGTATTSTQKLNSAIKLGIVGALISGLIFLISKLDLFGESADKAAEKAEKYNDALEAIQKSAELAGKEVDNLSRNDVLKARLAKKTQDEIKKIEKDAYEFKLQIYNANLEALHQLHAQELHDAGNNAKKKEEVDKKYFEKFNELLESRSELQREFENKALEEQIEIQERIDKRLLDLERIAAEEIAKIKENQLEQQFKLVKYEKQREIDFALQVVEDEKQSFSARFIALQTYLVQSRSLINAEQAYESNKIKQNASTAIAAIEFQAKEEKEKKGITEKEKQLIDKEAGLKIATIRKNANNDLLVVDEQHYDEEIRLLKNFNARQSELLKAEIEKFKPTLRDFNPLADKAAEGINAKILKQTQDRIDKEKSEAEQLELVKQKVKELKEELLFNSLPSSFFNIIGGLFDAQSNRIQEQIDKIDELKAKEIDRITASTDSEEQKAARIKIVEAKAQSDKEALDRRQREIERRRAIFDKAQKIFDITVEGIKGAQKIQQELLAAPIPLKPYWSSQLGLSLAVTGAQLAAVFATPLPKYARGGTVGRNTFAEVAEEGGELTSNMAVGSDGKLTKQFQYYPNRTVTWLRKGTTVYSANVTRQILEGAKVNNSNAETLVLNNSNDEVVEELRKANKKPPIKIVVVNQKDITTTAYFDQQMKH